MGLFICLFGILLEVLVWNIIVVDNNPAPIIYYYPFNFSRYMPEKMKHSFENFLK